jgi:hypothetical protein
MKNTLSWGLSLLMLACTYGVSAQDVIMDASTQGRIVYTHGGSFSDSGREGESYSNFEDNILTMCSSNGEPMSVDFEKFNLETEKDFLFVFDGMNCHAAPVKGSPFTGTKAKEKVIESTGSCLTFRMISDFNIKRSGWLADITVADQPVVAVE